MIAGLRARVPAAVVCVVATLASAPPAAASGADAEAATRYRDGIDRFKRWDFEGSRIALLQAYALDPKPKYLWDLAVAEAKANHPVEALQHFRKFFSMPGATDADRRKAHKVMSDAEARTGHVVVQAPGGAVLSVDGQAAQVYGDRTLDVTPGRHTVEARIGTNAASRDVAPRAGETVQLDLPVETPAPATAAASPPPLLPPAPPPAPTTPPGVAPTEPAPPPERVTPSRARWATSGALAVTGIGGLVTGGFFLVSAGNEDATWRALNAQTGACPQPPQTTACANLKSAADARVSDRTLGAVFTAGGAALVAGGVATWLLWPKAKGEESASLPVPWVTAGGGGVTWGGRF